MEPADLDDLLRRAGQNDAAALAELVNRYSPRVYGLLYRLTGSRDAADDLLQETFLRMVRTIAQYEHSGRFEPWLFRIAANVVRDRARQHRRRGVMASLNDADADPGFSANGRYTAAADVPLSSREDEQRLNDALRELSDPEREILLLRHYADMPFRDIAELLGVPLGTALARAHRALGRLRELMTGRDETMN